MTVSIIIPMYNVDKYIEACLESVLRQDFDDYEVILINDGSTDRTGELAQKFANEKSNFHYYEQENGGASVGRNTGLKYASGDYVYFLDSDDVMVEGGLKKIVSKAKENDADVVKFACYTFSDEDTTLRWEDNGYQLKSEYPLLMSGREFLQKSIPSGDAYLVNCGHVLVKRKLIEENSIRFFEGIIHEDVLFHWELMSVAKRVTVFNEPISCRRYRSGSVMENGKWDKRIVAMTRIIDETYEFLKKHPEITEEEAKWFLQMYAIKEMQFYEKMSRKERNNPKNRELIFNIRKQMKAHNCWGRFNLKLFSLSPTLYEVYHKVNTWIRKPLNSNT